MFPIDLRDPDTFTKRYLSQFSKEELTEIYKSLARICKQSKEQYFWGDHLKKYKDKMSKEELIEFNREKAYLARIYNPHYERVMDYEDYCP